MNFYNLVSLINQSIQALDTHPNQQLTPLIDDLTRAKAELNRLISRNASQDPIKEFLKKKADSIVWEKERLVDDADNLAHAPETLQEILRLDMIEDWLYLEIKGLENL